MHGPLGYTWVVPTLLLLPLVADPAAGHLACARPVSILILRDASVVLVERLGIITPTEEPRQVRVSGTAADELAGRLVSRGWDATAVAEVSTQGDIYTSIRGLLEAVEPEIDCVHFAIYANISSIECSKQSLQDLKGAVFRKVALGASVTFSAIHNRAEGCLGYPVKDVWNEKLDGQQLLTLLYPLRWKSFSLGDFIEFRGTMWDTYWHGHTFGIFGRSTLTSLPSWPIPTIHLHGKSVDAVSISSRRTPLLIKGSPATAWPLFGLTEEQICTELGGGNKVNASWTTLKRPEFFHYDTKALFANKTEFMVLQNVHHEGVTNCADVVSPSSVEKYWIFSDLPVTLSNLTDPALELFITSRDRQNKKQFGWQSSPGVSTLMHIDQDFNFFLQVKGRKRFTLFSHSDHEEMYIHSRLHPLWHKSQIDFHSPAMDAFPHFARATAFSAEVEPGDIVFIPPHTWHHVETLTQSFSITSWSHDYALYSHMDAIYRLEHTFEKVSVRGRVYVWKLVVDLLVPRVLGVPARVFVKRLREARHAHYNRAPSSEALCGETIPTCQWVYGDASMDSEVVASHFNELREDVRVLLFADYVEEFTAHTVGVDKTMAFFEDCFNGQEYQVTTTGSEEHSLWDIDEL